MDDVKKATNFIGNRIEEVRLDIREFESVSVDYDNDGKADVVISDPLADKKQGEGENRGHPEDVAMVAEEMSAHRKR